MERYEGIYGHTGEVGKDGLLTSEQQDILNKLQAKAAVSSMEYLDQMTEEQEYRLLLWQQELAKAISFIE